MTLTSSLPARMYWLSATVPPARAADDVVATHGAATAAERIRARAVPTSVWHEVVQPDTGTDTANASIAVPVAAERIRLVESNDNDEDEMPPYCPCLCGFTVDLCGCAPTCSCACTGKGNS